MKKSTINLLKIAFMLYGFSDCQHCIAKRSSLGGDSHLYLSDNANADEIKTKNLFFYTERFSDQLGLRDQNIIDMDSGLEAIVVIPKIIYKLDYHDGDPFLKKYHLTNLSNEDRDTVENHLAGLAILFHGQKIPLKTHEDCYLNLYFDSNDQRVKAISLPNKPVWWDKEQTDRLIYNMLKPIDFYRTQSAQEPDLTTGKSNLIESYNQYIQKSVMGPRAWLSHSPLGNLPTKSYVDLTYNGHMNHFLPGILYLSFQVPYCQMLIKSKKLRDVWLGIEAKQAISLPVVNKIPHDKNRYIIFRMPKSIDSVKQ